MRSLHQVLATLTLALVLIVSGCVTGTQRRADGITIRVANTVSPPRDMEVYLVEDRGSGIRLGTLRQSETRTFRTARQITARNVRLVGRSPGRADVFSAPFQLLPESGSFAWNMSFIEVEPGATVPR